MDDASVTHLMLGMIVGTLLHASYRGWGSRAPAAPAEPLYKVAPEPEMPVYRFDEPVTLYTSETAGPTPAIVRVIGPDFITLEPENMDTRDLYWVTGDLWEGKNGTRFQIKRGTA